jgi:hypothetical protein
VEGPPLPRTDLCDDFDKPQKLTMQYIGGADNVNSQDSSKVDISGDPEGTDPVFIIASNKDKFEDLFKSDAKNWFSGEVSLGGTFVIDSLPFRNELESATRVYIFSSEPQGPGDSGLLLQRVEFHTSCSQPLLLGDIFGAIQLVGFVDKNGQGASLP